MLLGLTDANSTEFKSNKNPVVSLMTEWKNENKIEKEIKLVIKEEQ